MRRREFESRVHCYRRIVRMLAPVYLVFVLTGPLGAWGIECGFVFEKARGCLRSEALAVVVTATGFVSALAVPFFVGPFLRKRYGLVCPHCHHLDLYGLFIRQVLQTGRCPRCRGIVLQESKESES